jgi:hypothetical protein
MQSLFGNIEAVTEDSGHQLWVAKYIYIYIADIQREGVYIPKPFYLAFTVRALLSFLVPDRLIVQT